MQGEVLRSLFFLDFITIALFISSMCCRSKSVDVHRNRMHILCLSVLIINQKYSQTIVLAISRDLLRYYDWKCRSHFSLTPYLYKLNRFSSPKIYNSKQWSSYNQTVFSNRTVPYPRDLLMPCDHSLTSSSAGGPLTCKDCGRVYKLRHSLVLHRKAHEGLTTCSICSNVFNRVPDLRTHLRTVHKLTKEEVKMLVPVTRRR